MLENTLDKEGAKGRGVASSLVQSARLIIVQLSFTSTRSISSPLSNLIYIFHSSISNSKVYMASPMQDPELFAPGDQGPGIITANVIVAAAATIGVALRLWARKIQKIPLKADDFTILASLPFGWAMCIACTIAVKHGLGRHIGTIPPADIIIFGQALLAGELIWTVSIPIIKLSILLLYTRIFGRLKYFRILAWTLGIFTTVWSVSIFVTLCLQCRPIQLNWDKTIPGTCIDTQKFYIAGSIPNTFTDLLILLLPLPAVWRLQTTKLQKATLTGIFFLGSL